MQRLSTHKNAFVWTLAALVLLVSSAKGEPIEFRNWPSGTSPREVGKRVAERFLSQPTETYRNPQPQYHYIGYPEVVTWYGALTFTRVSGEQALNQRLVDRFAALVKDEPDMIP